jgi:hypothetical protein
MYQKEKQMESYRIGNIIDSLFNQVVENNESFESGKDGIMFNIKIKGDNHGFEKDGFTHHSEWQRSGCVRIGIIILKGRYVFSLSSQNNKDEDILSLYDFDDMIKKPELWKNESNHESCYRDAIKNIITDAYLNIGLYINNVPDEHKPSKITGNVNIYLSEILRPLFTLVEVKHIPIYPTETYFRRLTEIKRITKNVNL